VAGAALQSEPVRAALGWVSAALKAAASAGKQPSERRDTAAAAAAAVAAVDKAEKKDVGGVVAERRVSGSGHEREAAEEAQEAGELVDVRLYAPGRIFWLVSRRIDLAWPGLIWSGLARSPLIWSGLARPGLSRPGLA
jgi:hypothetical protein